MPELCKCGRPSKTGKLCAQGYARFRYLIRTGKLDSDRHEGNYCPPLNCECGQVITHKTTRTCDECYSKVESDWRKNHYKKNIT